MALSAAARMKLHRVGELGPKSVWRGLNAFTRGAYAAGSGAGDRINSGQLCVQTISRKSSMLGQEVGGGSPGQVGGVRLAELERTMRLRCYKNPR